MPKDNAELKPEKLLASKRRKPIIIVKSFTIQRNTDRLLVRHADIQGSYKAGLVIDQPTEWEADLVNAGIAEFYKEGGDK